MPVSLLPSSFLPTTKVATPIAFLPSSIVKVLL
nr:MAG TPA: hypothetical protein [Caudoviricetes sp.]